MSKEAPPPTKVKVDHECYIPVSKHKIIDKFLKDPLVNKDKKVKKKWQDFVSLIEAIYHFEYHKLAENLKRDYLFFEPNANPHERADLSDEELEEIEDRFLCNFFKLMERGNFIPLTQKDVDVAEEENYLFTLPMDIDWDRHDQTMLKRFFQKHPQITKELSLPKFTDRCLIFRRGVGVDRVSSYMFMEKMDMLIENIYQSVADFFRYIIGIFKKHEKAGEERQVKEEKQQPSKPVSKDGDSASGIVKLVDAFSFTLLEVYPDKDGTEEIRRISVGDKGKEHIFQERYIKRIHLKHYPRKLSTYFKKIQLQEPTFERIVMLFRLKDKKEDKPDPTIYVKIFRDIPMADLEMIFPEKKIKMKAIDTIKIVGCILAGVAMVIWRIMTERKGMLLPIIIGTLFLYALKVFMAWSQAKETYLSIITSSLYYKNLDNNIGVLQYLIDAVEEQEFKEAALAYFLLWKEETGLSKRELDVKAEKFLLENFHIEVNFEVKDAMAKVLKEGIVTEENRKDEKRYVAMSLDETLTKLDYKWDNYFKYNV